MRPLGRRVERSRFGAGRAGYRNDNSSRLNINLTSRCYPLNNNAGAVDVNVFTRTYVLRVQNDKVTWESRVSFDTTECVFRFGFIAITKQCTLT